MKTCGKCAHAKFPLSSEDQRFLEGMRMRYSEDSFLGWLKGHVKTGPRHNQNKVKATKLLRVQVFCPVEQTWVCWLEEGCYAWQPYEGHAP